MYNDNIMKQKQQQFLFTDLPTHEKVFHVCNDFFKLYGSVVVMATQGSKVHKILYVHIFFLFFLEKLKKN